MFLWQLTSFMIALAVHRYIPWYLYRIYSKYSDRQSGANSVDPDQTPHNAASDLGLHCLPP